MADDNNLIQINNIIDNCSTSISKQLAKLDIIFDSIQNLKNKINECDKEIKKKKLK